MTVLIKAVTEVFAPQFLLTPVVVRANLPGGATSLRGDDLCESLGFPMVALKDFPEVTLADASPEDFNIIFVSVAPTPKKGGGMTNTRKERLLCSALATGLQPMNVRFVSAFADRRSPAFRNLVSKLAWGTLVWFASEPNKLLAFREGQTVELPGFLR
jgi:hypothetical protein